MTYFNYFVCTSLCMNMFVYASVLCVSACACAHGLAWVGQKGEVKDLKIILKETEHARMV